MKVVTSKLLKSKVLVLAGSTLALAQLLPSQLQPITFYQFKKPMSIHNLQTDPAREAFELVTASISAEPEIDAWDIQMLSPAINLNEGLKTSATHIRQTSQLYARRMLLAPMQFHHTEVFPEDSMGHRLAVTKASADAQGQDPTQDQEWMAGLSRRERERLQEAQTRSADPIGAEPAAVAGSTWREFAEQKISKFNEQERVRSSSNNGGIFISATDENGVTRTPASYQNQQPVALAAVAPATHTLSVPVKYAKGLAGGDHTLAFYHNIDGIPVESGTVDPVTGRGQITVADNRGELVADLLDKTGAPVASGRVKLTGVDIANNSEIRVSQTSQLAANFIDFNRTSGSVVNSSLASARGEKADVLIASLGVEQKTDELGSLQFSKVSPNSWALVRAQAKGFRESLLTMPAGEAKNYALMPESLMKTFDSLTDTHQDGSGTNNHDETNSGLIWGQVLYNGKPLSGIAVSLDTTTNKTIYLNGFIPTNEAATTFDNGYFVMRDLPPGFYQLTAKRGDEEIGHLNVQVDSNSVTTGNLEISGKTQTCTIKSYDAFTGEALNTQVDLQSVKESVDVTGGQAIVSLQDVHRLALGYVYPKDSDYVPAQIVYTDDASYIHTPLVRASWLQEMLAQKKINMSGSAGIVIGFVPEDNFDVYLPHESNYSEDNKIFFDVQGRMTDKGVAGGGFILANVPASTQSIVVMNNRTEFLHVSVVPVDAASTTILDIRF